MSILALNALEKNDKIDEIIWLFTCLGIVEHARLTNQTPRDYPNVLVQHRLLSLGLQVYTDVVRIEWVPYPSTAV